MTLLHVHINHQDFKPQQLTLISFSCAYEFVTQIKWSISLTKQLGQRNFNLCVLCVFPIFIIVSLRTQTPHLFILLLYQMFHFSHIQYFSDIKKRPDHQIGFHCLSHQFHPQEISCLFMHGTTLWDCSMRMCFWTSFWSSSIRGFYFSRALK